MTRAALYGGSPAYRRGLRDGLADHGWTVDLPDDHAAPDGDHTVALVRLPAPDPALLPPGVDDDASSVVVLTPEPITEDHVALVRAGVDAVSDSNDDPGRVAALLDALEDGRTLLPTGTMQRLVAIARSRRDLATTYGWSDRGMHRALAALYDRIGVDNRDQAVAWAARHDLLDE